MKKRRLKKRLITTYKTTNLVWENVLECDSG